MEGENMNAAEPVKSVLRLAEIQALAMHPHRIFHSPPKSRDDSSAPLLNDAEAQHEAGVSSQQASKFDGIQDKTITAALLKLFVTMAPFLIVCSSWAVLLGAGVDPLAFGMLAFFLTLALSSFLLLIADVRIRMGYATKSKQPIKDWKEVMYMTLGMLGIYVLFYSVIWVWAIVFNDDGPGVPSVWYMYHVYYGLQAKIDAPHALATLGSCLQEAIPYRNATIADVSACLKSMGIADSYIE